MRWTLHGHIVDISMDTHTPTPPSRYYQVDMPGRAHTAPSARRVHPVPVSAVVAEKNLRVLGVP